MTVEKNPICYVIMPFSKTTPQHTENYWTQHYQDFIKPLIESHPLKAERSAALRGDILRQIIVQIVTSQIVVADLTDANPNVYWELGVRQSFKHCTITIAQSGTRLPFDLSTKGTLRYYPTNHLKMHEFEKKFSEAIDDCLCNPKAPDSQVLETIGGRGTLFQILMRDESIRRLNAVLSEIGFNRNLLDRILELCNKNIELRQKDKTAGSTVVTSRMRLTAAELLLANRYVDADESFYGKAEKYVNNLIAINEQISAWDISTGKQSTEQWLVDHNKRSRPILEAFLSALKEQQQQLTKSL